MLHSPDERLETDTEVTHRWTMFAVQIDRGGSLCVPFTFSGVTYFCNLLTDTFLLAKIDKCIMFSD